MAVSHPGSSPAPPLSIAQDLPARLEVRWFVPGPLPSHVRRWAHASQRRTRTDRYFDDVSQALKARAVGTRRARLETKTLLHATPRAELVPGVSGVVQCWTTRTPATLDLPPQSIDVRKRRWSGNGLELVELTVDATVFWSLSLKGRTTIDATRIASFPDMPVLDAAVSCSYPEFLFGT